MQPARSPSLVECLRPEVVGFCSEENGFVLRENLDRLDRARGARAQEAEVDCCKRILDAMTRHLVRAVYTPSDSLARNLKLLQEFYSVSALKPLLDQLGAMGNDARPVHRGLTTWDADVAFILLLRWLHWFFCEYSWGPRLPSITVANRPLNALLPSQLTQLIEQVEHDSNPRADLLASLRLKEHDSLALLTPIIPAVLAEILLGRERQEEAFAVLEAARQRFEDDVRLKQLVALYWSRRGDREGKVEHLHLARHALEGIAPTISWADEETLGILAGIYKRLAQLDSADAWLRKCQETYRAGWVLSEETNWYLGINAAATALWLGQQGEVVHLAGLVRKSLENLRQQLQASPGGPRPLTYWDQVTLAEAYLLLRDLDRAGPLYRDAFARFPEKTSEIGVTKKQAQRNLEHLGLSGRADEVLGP